MIDSSRVYTVDQVINGVTYTAQFCGLSQAMKMVDESYLAGSDNLSMQKLAKFVLENVIVSPRRTVDDFDDMDELNEVIAFGQKVCQGSFRDRKNTPVITEAKS